MKIQVQKIVAWMPVLTALVIPVHPRFTVISLLLWVVGVLVLEVAWKVAISQQTRVAQEPLMDSSRWFGMWSILTFVLLACTLIWTESVEDGLLQLETKFSMLLIPLLFWHYQKRLGRIEKEKIVAAFLIGIGVFMCWRFMHALFSLEENAWRYDGLAGPFHPTYLGMYLVIVAVLNPLNEHWQKVHLFLSGLFVGLLASKAAWIIGCVIWSIEIIRLVRINKQFAWPYGVAIVLLLSGGWAGDQGRWQEFQQYVFSKDTSIESIHSGNEPLVVTKLQNEGPSENIGSSGGRVQAWNASWKVLTNHPLGVGIGDSQDVLNSFYEADGAHYARKKSMNSHSVWLQMGISSGWLGIVFLILWWGGTLRLAWIERNWHLIAWSMIWLLNGVLESLLELQQGVVPFIFITLVLCSGYLNRKEKGLLG
ncbi:MAG: O-antigen ligase family protein [Bacteroidetes bacterium]|nr:O-antigen ligase family protein [Bacteroidota bacterium]